MASKADVDEEGVDLYFYLDCSVKLPPELTAQGNRVGFHLGPFRGGSPVQNTIAEGIEAGLLCCFLMDEELDRGRVVCCLPVPLLGGAEEIYNRMAYACFLIISEMANGDGMEVLDQPIEGEFRARRTPEQSEVPQTLTSLHGLYDHIRMLDAPGYPPAFIRWGDFKLHFTRPCFRTGTVQADVTITHGGGQ